MDQIRLVHLFERSLILTDGNRDRAETNRSAVEALGDCPEILAVGAIEAILVDTEKLQRLQRSLAINAIPTAHLRNIAHAPQDAVGDARCAPRPTRDLARGILIDRQTENARRARDDEQQLVRRVVLESQRDTETIAHRRGQKSRACRRTHQRERCEIEPERTRSWPLTNHDVDSAVLHRGIQELLDGTRKPMHLIDEEDVVRFEGGQDRSDVALALQRRSRDRVNPAFHFDGHNERETGLAQSWWSGEKHVITRLTATARGSDEGLQLTHRVLLPDEITQPLRPQRTVDFTIFRLLLAGDDARVIRHQRPPPSWASAALMRSSAEPSAPCKAASASINE